MDSRVVVEIKNAAVRFNMASQRVSSLKEYVIKFLKKELMFQEFLALQDIDLEIRAGESWGIIGTNGAGKSTLLKLICGILKPYRGSVKVNGSIAPLIELGAGFDGELTAEEIEYLKKVLVKKWVGRPYKSVYLHSCRVFWICRLKTIPQEWRQGSGFRWRQWCSRTS